MSSSSSAVRTHRARRLSLLLTTAALVPGLAACGGGSGSSSTSTTAQATTSADTSTGDATTSTDTTSTTATSGGCKTVEQPQPRTDEPHLSAPKPARLTGRWTVTMTTNCGSFTIRLDTKQQPKTAASFKALVAAKFYDDLTFHRVVPNFVIQGGDPNGDGSGGPGYSVRETPPANVAYTRGVVAMAKTGTEPAGTSGSQFYVVTSADAGLPADYAVVGKVIKGLDTVNRIAAKGVSDGPPSEPIVIQKATAARG